MTQQKKCETKGIEHKKGLLNTIYEVYAGWVERFPLACRKGCSVCCTQSVTMTSLEGEMIIDFLKAGDREDWLSEKLSRVDTGNSAATVTTNQFARACLDNREVAEDAFGGWNFSPCVFLREDLCAIYEVRPFGCRSFGSVAQCSGKSGATIIPIHLAVNTVFSQIIEHLCSDGGEWGNMADVLTTMHAKNEEHLFEKLLPAQSIPGFLLEPFEKKLVHVLLGQLYEESAEDQAFGDLIDNFMPI